MHRAIITLLFAGLTITTAAQVTCTPYSTYDLTACPYAAPTTEQLYALIDTYCNGTACEGNGGLPCYYYGDITQSTSDGKSYYMVATNTVYSGREGQATCYSALQEIVAACNEQYGEYGWDDGYQTVDGYPFEVLTCALA